MCFRMHQIHSHLYYACCALPGLCWPSQVFIPSQILNPLKSSMTEGRIIVILLLIRLWKKKSLIKGNNVLCMSKILLPCSDFHMYKHCLPWGSCTKLSQTSFFLMIWFPSINHLGANASRTTESNKNPTIFGAIWILIVWLRSISVSHSRVLLLH